MQKRSCCILTIAVLAVLFGGVLCYNVLVVETDTLKDRNSLIQEESKKINANADITEISVDSVKGILPEEAEKLCFFVLGEKDAETGFPFSFSVAGAVETDKKQ